MGGFIKIDLRKPTEGVDWIYVSGEGHVSGFCEWGDERQEIHRIL